MRTDPARVLGACAALPPLALIVFVASTTIAAIAREHPQWHGAELNMAEAAAARDVGTLAAMLDRGEDPNRALPVRPPLLDSTSPTVTPLEAGVLAGRLEVVHLLVTRGASVDADHRAMLACEARRRGYTDVAEYLAGTADPPCS